MTFGEQHTCLLQAPVGQVLNLATHYALDIDKTATNGGQGYGWNRIWLDEVRVSDDGVLTYGVTTRQNSNYNGKWFSACDFIVERVDD